MDNDLAIGADAASATIITEPELAHKIVLCPDGETVGVLDFGAVPVTFTGDADASAVAFFDAVANYFEEVIDRRVQQGIAERRAS